MKIYKTKHKINKCSECPFIKIESDTLGPEAFTANCKTNNLKYYCDYKDEYKFLGEMNWEDGKWVGSFVDKIPTWCLLPENKNPKPRKPKYNALRISDKKYADDYGAKMKRYRGWEESEK